MVSANKLFGFTAALLMVFALPFLAGSNHTCPVLREREPATGSSAQAIPAFARKYNVDCTYCHTAWPQLNRTGLIFRYLGYRMPYEVPTMPGAKHHPATTQGNAPGLASTPSPAGGTAPKPATGGGTKQPPSPAMIEDGKRVANQMQCMTCHVDGGNVVNPSKPIKGAAFARRYTDDAQIAAVIRHGVPGTAMPAYSTDRMSDEQLDLLIGYIRSLTPQP